MKNRNPANQAPRTSQRSRAGFTLLDVMIVVAIIGVVGAVAMPGVRSKLPAYRLDKAASAVVSELHVGRVRSRSRNLPVEVEIDDNALALHMKMDLNGNGLFDAGETATLDLSSIKGLSLDPTVATGSFSPRGTFSCTGGTMRIGVTVAGGGTEYVYVFGGGQVHRSEDLL